MTKFLFSLILFFTFIFPYPTNAATAPTLIEPEDNFQTTDHSPKLSWNYSGKCPSSGNCYLIEIAKTLDFLTTEKSTYTNNSSYSPNLSEGTWYWRVKAKDEDNAWSEYSENRIVKIGISPLPPPTSNPSIAPTPQPTPTATPITQNQGNTEKEKSIFQITISKNSIKSDESLSINITMTGFVPFTTFYLKPSYYQEGSTNYFGLTNINNEWLKNSITASNQLKVITDTSGNWSGTIEVKVDTGDSGFKGQGNYNLKVGRYSQSGSGPSWSNSLSLFINHTEVIEQKDETIINESTPNPSANSEILGISNQIKVPEEQTELISKNDRESTSSPNSNYQIATISAAKKEVPHNISNETLIKGEKQINWWFISSGVLMLSVSTIYVVYKRKKLYYS